jgi:hypothetical protein
LINGVAHNGTLDIAAMTANASLAITPWPLQVAGKKVWLTFHCEGANPNPYNVWTGYAHPSASGIDHFVLLSWLKSCPNGNQIWVDFKVAYDPNADEAEAVSFPRTVYTVNNFVESTDFNDRNWNNWIKSNASGSIVGSGSNWFFQGTGNIRSFTGVYKRFDYGYLVVGQRYRLTFDFIISTTYTIYLRVTPVGTANHQSAYYGGTNSWKTASFDFTPPANPNNVQLEINISHSADSNNVTVSIDNIKIVKL